MPKPRSRNTVLLWCGSLPATGGGLFSYTQNSPTRCLTLTVHSESFLGSELVDYTLAAEVDVPKTHALAETSSKVRAEGKDYDHDN